MNDKKELMKSLDEFYEKTKKLTDDKFSDEEVPFVVGGVYKETGFFYFLAMVYHSNPSLYWLRSFNCVQGWYCGEKEDVIKKLKQGNYKYTGKTLQDLIEEKNDE